MSSSYERGRKAEEAAKEWLQSKFEVSFSERDLQVGDKSDGKPAMHSFDLVSEDGQTVAEVKSHQLTKSGNIPSGKISDTYKACLMLEKVDARKKFLILTDSKFYDLFKRYSNGKISKQIEITLLSNEKCERRPSSVETRPLSSRIEVSEKDDFNIFWSKVASWLSK